MYLLIEEFSLDGNQRVVKVLTDEEVFYSIDYYEKINIEPECIKKISINDLELCYFSINERCKGLIVKSPDSIEIVSLRYFIDKEEYNKVSYKEIYTKCIELLNDFKLNYKKEQNP